MRFRGSFCIALVLLFCNARTTSGQPPAPSPEFLAGINYDDDTPPTQTYLISV
jgi:hypothetical protein